MPNKNPKPQPWYLGFGLARFAGDKLKKSREERKRKMAKVKKELQSQKAR